MRQTSYRLKDWKKELKQLSKETGISMSQVSVYIGGPETGTPGFYRKMPRKRDVFIGIGMAYGLPLNTINRWIREYGMKKELYVMDLQNDLAWIYLIMVNDRSGDRNYFMMHDECSEVIREEYYRMWECRETGQVPRENSENAAEYIDDEEYGELRRFVRQNMENFISAYAKPRKMLNDQVQMILDAKNGNPMVKRTIKLNGLRGYLDDSMINYISGGFECINTLDKSGKRTPGIKQIPKNRRAHISICLALGMTSKEIDKYLTLMGYAPLDSMDKEEGWLIREIEKWEDEYPLQKSFKEGRLVRASDRARAADEMLMLRSDLKAAYEEQNGGCSFRYLKD